MQLGNVYDSLLNYPTLIYEISKDIMFAYRTHTADFNVPS
jgi:hypothetical protein